MALDLDGLPHPRFRHDLVGHSDAVQALLDAEASGRLHHAWLIGGPDGIGKATLAYLFARCLLAPAAERAGQGLGTDPLGRTARQIGAGAHPNLAVVERVSADREKAPPKTISVDAVRKTLAFFGSTAADGGRRICIVDSVDDLTPPAANALLKTIEEPPANALVLLVSHAPRRVLPTIRSRCRKLTLQPLAAAEVAAVVASLEPDLGPIESALAARAAELAEGSVGRALGLLDPKRIALIDEVTGLLDGLPGLPARRLMTLADKLGDRKAADEFVHVVDAMQGWLASRVRAGLQLGPARLAPLAEVCENLTEAARTLEIYNLDRRAFIVSTFGDLADAVRRAA